MLWADFTISRLDQLNFGGESTTLLPDFLAIKGAFCFFERLKSPTQPLMFGLMGVQRVAAVMSAFILNKAEGCPEL